MEAVVCARVSRIKWLKAGLLVPFDMYCVSLIGCVHPPPIGHETATYIILRH